MRLDGNAIAGLLHEVYAREMTLAAGTCAGCGSTSLVGSLHVYVRAPGTVVRCPHCESVLLVLVRRGDVVCIDGRGLAVLEPSADDDA